MEQADTDSDEIWSYFVAVDFLYNSLNWTFDEL